MLFDTIVAIATPIGIGGVGIIRLSGSLAVDIALRFTPSKGSYTPRFMHFCKLLNPQSKQLLDEGCIVYFKAPHSYTGEDIIEFHLHGNPYLLQDIVSLCIQQGARMAQAGEFTKRAYINGKIELTKAESVAALIHAQTHRAQHASIEQFDGALAKTLRHTRQQLMLILEHLQGNIDFPDEIEAMNREVLVSQLTSIRDTLHTIFSYQDYGKHVFSGIQCLIIGSPNAGKSSLLNQLSGQSRALVSKDAGTTRDFIDIQIDYEGLLFQFTDTAGIQSTEDKIEKKGIQKIKSLMTQSDVVLWIIDQSKPFTKSDTDILKKIPRKKTLFLILNKKDKPRRWIPIPSLQHHIQMSISAKTGEGIDTLKKTLWETFAQSNDTPCDEFLCNTRQMGCLKRSLNTLTELIEATQSGFEESLLVIDLMSTIQAMGELTGEEITEEMLDGVFSKFCVGK